MEDNDELIWWKQTAIRLIAFADLCTDSKLNELQAMLNDVETRGWEEDEKAIQLLIQLLELYKEVPDQPV